MNNKIKNTIGYILLWALLTYIVFALTGCTENIETPVCGIATIEHKVGNDWCVTVKSDAPSVTMCRDFGARVSCWTIVDNYYECITIETHIGEIITFDDGTGKCELEVR